MAGLLHHCGMRVLEAVAEPASLAQVPDNVLVMVRNEKSDQAKIIVKKNRDVGRRGYVQLAFDPRSQTFTEGEPPERVLRVEPDPDWRSAASGDDGDD